MQDKRALTKQDWKELNDIGESMKESIEHLNKLRKEGLVPSDSEIMAWGIKEAEKVIQYIKGGV